MTIREQILDLILQLDLSISDAAKRILMSRSDLSRYVHARGDITTDKASRLLAALKQKVKERDGEN